MLETYRDIAVATLLSNLKRELDIEGVPESNRALILEEVHGHVLEALDAENAFDSENVDRVLLLFGNEQEFAKSLAAEYRNANSKKPFLWPCVTLVATQVALAILSFLRLQGPEYAFFLKIVIGLAVMALAVCGYRARRPLIGQFLGFAATWIVGLTLWYAIACIPLGYGPEEPSFAEPIARWTVVQEEAHLNDYLARNLQASREVSYGKRFFQDGTSSPVPSFLRMGDRYLLPTGVQDTSRQIPFPSSDPLRVVGSLEEARKTWLHTDFQGGLTRADITKDMCDRDVYRLRYNLWFIDWIQRQPFQVKIGYDFQMALMAWAVFPAAAAITNLGWLIWFLSGLISRHLRRVRYTQGLLSAPSRF